MTRFFWGLVSTLDLRHPRQLVQLDTGDCPGWEHPDSHNQSGRDHWLGCYAILLAGAGIRGGTYYGQSGCLGWDPIDKLIQVGDFAATPYDAYGLDPHGMVCDSIGRPYLLADGAPVADLLNA